MQMAPIDGIQNVEVRLSERPRHAHLRCRSGARDCNDQSREGLAVHWMRKKRGSANVHWSLQRPQVEFVYTFEYEDALAPLTGALIRIGALETIADQLAWTKSRTGEWGHPYRSLQQRARKRLA